MEFPSVARVYFPAGAFEDPETVTIWITDLPSTEKGAQDYDLGDGGWPPYLPNDVTIEAAIRPRVALEVTFILPESGVQCGRAEFTPRVFREFTGGGAMEALIMYEALFSTLDLEQQTIRAQVSASPVKQGSRLWEKLHVGCFRP